MSETNSLTDEELIIRVRTSDKELYSKIVERYEKKLLRYADLLIKNKDKAEDIVQQSFIKAYVNLNGFNTNKKFSSWIYRIVHNEAMNIIKKYKKETPLKLDADFKSAENVEEEYLRKELINSANNCLNEMPVIYREPLALQYLEEKSYDEISDILHLPIGTVAVRIKRAKALMKKICQEKK